MTTTDQAATGTQNKGDNISRLQNIEVQLTVEVGGTKITIEIHYYCAEILPNKLRQKNLFD